MGRSVRIYFSCKNQTCCGCTSCDSEQSEREPKLQPQRNKILILLTRWAVAQDFLAKPAGLLILLTRNTVWERNLDFLTRQPILQGTLNFPNQTDSLVSKSLSSLPHNLFCKEFLIFLTRRPIWEGSLNFYYRTAALGRTSRFSLPDGRFGKDILIFLTRRPIW